MKGKIVEYGIILGDDGFQYSFSYDDIINLNVKGNKRLENLEVDFIPNDNIAKEIYLLLKENTFQAENILKNNPKTQIQLNDKKLQAEIHRETTYIPFANEIAKIKKDTYISWACVVLLCLLFLEIELPSFIVLTSGLLFLFFKSRAIYLLGKISKSTKLFKVYCGYMIFVALLSWITIPLFLRYKTSGAIFGLSILMLYFGYKYTKELYNVILEDCFFHSFFFECISTIIFAFAYYSRHHIDDLDNLWILASTFELISIILIIVAWIKFKKIIIQ